MRKTQLYLILLDIEIYNDDPEYPNKWKQEMLLRQNFDDIDPNIYERLDRCHYEPTNSLELYDFETDKFYDINGVEKS